MIYLDHASHTPADPEVIDVFCRMEREYSANPMSTHGLGQAAKEKFAQITADIATLLGAKPEDLTFTSGATESNSLAITDIAKASRHNGKHIIANHLEHPSITGPLATLQQQGYEIEMVDILPTGSVDIDHLKQLLRPDTILVTAPWVDSELGAIQPIKAISKALEDFPNCRLHVDAAQAAGKIPISFEGINSLSISPHKFHGICGIGILLYRASIVRSGTPPLSLAAASHKALTLALQRGENIRDLKTHLVNALGKYPKVRINSPKDGSPYILNISVAGIKGSDFQEALDRHGICISVKSACAVQGTPSRPVYAISRDKKNAMSSWRISLSHCTKISEIEAFIIAFEKCCKELGV